MEFKAKRVIAIIPDMLCLPLFQTIIAAMVVNMKIKFQAIRNAQFGGVTEGLIISALYQGIPRFVK